MAAGQLLNVVVCSASSIGAAAGELAGPAAFSACPVGHQAYVVSAYVPFSSSQHFIDGLMSPFDPAAASGIFGFGFGVVVFFYLLGLKGSVILRHFWPRRY
jgi:hypothetical protein